VRSCQSRLKSDKISSAGMSLTSQSRVRVSEAPTLAPSSRRGLRSVIGGGLTGGINICIVFPTEFVKTQLQLDSGRKTYTGCMDVVRKTVQEKGVRGMYRGISILLTGTIPTYAVRFGTFDHLKSQFCEADGDLTPLTRLGCGLSAGVAEATLVVTWVETLKVRLISDQRKSVPQYRGLVHAASSILRAEGICGLYRGLAPTILKQGSNQAIRFSVMDSLRKWYTGGEQAKPVPKVVVAGFGAIAGGCSVLGNTPLDVLKTRMQNRSYSSTMECARQLALKEGVRGFYKGCLPRMNRVCLEVALAFCIYDTVMDIFRKAWP